MYNGEEYLRQCIDSILAQTYTDFELLLLDDCSTDQTRSIAQSYASSDSRVRLITNSTNRGLVGNWNRCIDLASGDWIKFVFQDDTIHPECLARMLGHARDRIVFVACQRTLVFEAGTEPAARDWYVAHRKLVAELFAESQVVSAERCQELALEYFGINVFGEPTSVLIHRSAFEKVGRFNPALIMNCDFEMWIRIAIQFGAAFVAEELATFRVHRGSTSTANIANRQFRSRVLDSLVILHQYLKDPMYEPVRRAAARLSPPLDLEKVFAWRCHDARWAAEWAMRDREQRDPSLAAQLREVTGVYPAIGRTGASHLLWRLRQRLHRQPEPPIMANAKRVV
jgi:glycosyltransferase involved in cell wall biosynthesis